MDIIVAILFILASVLLLVSCTAFFGIKFLFTFVFDNNAFAPERYKWKRKYTDLAYTGITIGMFSYGIVIVYAVIDGLLFGF